MKIRLLAASMAATVFFAPFASAQNPDGQALFNQYCMACHGGEHMAGRVAPPIFAVKNHYMRFYPDEDRFVLAVSDWLEAPSVEKTLMPRAVQRFNLMPPLPLGETEKTTIAEFIYATNFNTPSWYKQHYRQQHGEAPLQN